MTVPMPERRNLLHAVASKSAYLSPALRQVADLVLARPEDVQAMSITELAQESGVAESTVTRFTRELGLDSYNALRLGLAEAVFTSRANAERAGSAGLVYEGILPGDSVADVVAKVVIGSRSSLENTQSRLDVDAVERIVEMIDAANVLHFVGMGGSAIAAENAVIRFMRAGKRCMLFRDQSLQVMTAATLGVDDLVIGISDSGASIPVVETLQLAAHHGAATAAITSTERSPVTAVADVVLYTGNAPDEAGVYGEAVTAKWGQLLAVDALYAAYAATHYETTVSFLEETYQSAIKGTRRR